MMLNYNNFKKTLWW